jgi:hypothetical protein
MSRPYRCTCGHIELDQPGTYYCEWHGETILPTKSPRLTVYCQ